MIEENKDQFKTILTAFMSKYTFNPELFIEAQEEI